MIENHSCNGIQTTHVSKNEGSASITGGYFYRSMTDPCMYSRYLYTDLYAGAIWAGTESSENSGNFTIAQISFGCLLTLPSNVARWLGNPLPTLGYVFLGGQQ